MGFSHLSPLVLQALKTMMVSKGEMEDKIAMLTEVLESTPAGLNGPLLDRSGWGPGSAGPLPTVPLKGTFC